MAINWFPGHMNKARREIRKAMPSVDFILEVLDARIPFSSANPLVPELRGQTPCIKVLNKSDLADPERTRAWIQRLESEPGVKAITLHREQRRKAKGLLATGRGLLPRDRNARRRITVMILGIPNVGKSTLLNTLAGRNVARTANVPAVTRAQQEIRVGDFALLDTPGFLWPRLTPPECGFRLAVTGAIRDAVTDPVEVARFAARHLMAHYPELLRARYRLAELPDDDTSLLEAIAKKRGCLARGGVPDMERVSALLLHELRQGTIGRVSLEAPAIR